MEYRKNDIVTLEIVGLVEQTVKALAKLMASLF